MRREQSKVTTHLVQLLLAGKINGGAVVEGEGGGSSVGVVGGKGDPHTYQVLPVFHLHCAAALRGLQLAGEE